MKMLFCLVPCSSLLMNYLIKSQFHRYDVSESLPSFCRVKCIILLSVLGCQQRVSKNSGNKGSGHLIGSRLLGRFSPTWLIVMS